MFSFFNFKPRFSWKKCKHLFMKNTHIMLEAPDQNSPMFGFHTCMLWCSSLKHILCTFYRLLRSIFKFLLKSITSQKIHSTEVCTRLKDKLKASIPGVNLAPLNGDCKWILIGYAGSPYKHMSRPVGEWAWFSKSSMRPESLSIPASLMTFTHWNSI